MKRQKILEWESMEYLYFSRNCVCIGKAGFNLHITRTRGTPAKAIVPTVKEVSITIFDAISEADVFDVLLKKPQPVSAEKEKKINA
jgi:hypothetical protein